MQHDGGDYMIIDMCSGGRESWFRSKDFSGNKNLDVFIITRNFAFEKIPKQIRSNIRQGILPLTLNLERSRSEHLIVCLESFERALPYFLSSTYQSNIDKTMASSINFMSHCSQ